MPAGLFVDLLHPSAENHAVCRCVLPLFRQDLVVDHFVQENIFQLVFRQIVLCADPDAEAIVFDFSEEVAPFFVGACAQAAHGAAQFDRNRLERSGKTGFVERVETFLQKWQGGDHHAKIRNNPHIKKLSASPENSSGEPLYFRQNIRIFAK